jgi:Na+-transporting NADH:ubiquinone oxidoreductase subunit NqrD
VSGGLRRIGGCLLLLVAFPVLVIVLALLPPVAFFLVSWVIWTVYFYRKDNPS